MKWEYRIHIAYVHTHEQDTLGRIYMCIYNIYYIYNVYISWIIMVTQPSSDSRGSRKNGEETVMMI